jgi:hypothetical protein
MVLKSGSLNLKPQGPSRDCFYNKSEFLLTVPVPAQTLSQLRHCNRSASAGNYEDIAFILMYRDIQGVRTGIRTANSKWESREEVIVN